MSDGKPVLNSLWVGNTLGFVERLCLMSALGTGHHFKLYSYEPDKLQGVPAIAPNYSSNDRALPDLGRVGVDMTDQRSLTLNDAITLALENNKDIEVTR